MFRSVLAILLILPAGTASSRRLKLGKSSKKDKCCEKTVWAQDFVLQSEESDISYGQSFSPQAGGDMVGPPPTGGGWGGERKLHTEAAPSFPLPALVGALFINRGCVEIDNGCDSSVNHYTTTCTILEGGYTPETGIPTGGKVQKQMCLIDVCVGPDCFYLRFSGINEAQFTFSMEQGTEDSQVIPIPKFKAALYAGLGSFAGAEGEATVEQAGANQSRIDLSLRWVASEHVPTIWDVTPQWLL